MKKIILILFLGVTIFVNAQTKVTWKDLKQEKVEKTTIFTLREIKEKREGRYKVGSNRGNYSVTTYKNGKEKKLEGKYQISSKNGDYSLITFKNGKIVGKRKDFSSDKKIRCSRNYKNGMYHGKWTYFDKDNKINKIENFKGGEKDGKFWRNSRHHTETEYYNKGKKTGVWTSVNALGILENETTYIDKDNFTKKEFHKKNGKLLKQITYKNRKLHGKQLKYSKSGVLLENDVYKDGDAIKTKHFYSNGRKYKVFDSVSGYYVKYNYDGTKSLETHFKNHLQHGILKDYQNGNLDSETMYVKGVKQGVYKRYHPSGIIKEKGQYLKDEYNGLWKLYNKAGKLVIELKYDRGIELYRKVYKK